MQSTDPAKVTCHCPTGHKVRGDIAMTGERVVCPACKTPFTFGVVNTDKATVSDTGVMRILGDFDAPETIDSDVPKATVPCGRCGVAIEQTATVCKHCNTYASAMPSFMRSMLNSKRVS